MAQEFHPGNLAYRGIIKSASLTLEQADGFCPVFEKADHNIGIEKKIKPVHGSTRPLSSLEGLADPLQTTKSPSKSQQKIPKSWQDAD